MTRVNANPIQVFMRPVLIILLTTSAFAGAGVISKAWQTLVPDPPPDAQALLRDGRKLLEEARSTLVEDALIGAKKLFDACVQMDEKQAQCFYELARTEAYLTQSRHLRRDKKTAVKWLDSAIESDQHAIQLNHKSSDAHALLGDRYGAKINLGGMTAGWRYGPMVGKEDAQALELDANDPRAHAAMARRYFFAPAIFGGNIEKALESFKKATTLDPTDDETFVWLAIAQRKKGHIEEADKAISEALRLNPRSVFAKRVLAGAAE
jgi:tetratricopeptide (TPR) repeat protein